MNDQHHCSYLLGTLRQFDRLAIEYILREELLGVDANTEACGRISKAIWNFKIHTLT